MSGTGLLGDFEQLVLLAILQQRADGYAILIRREIEEATDRPVSRGALYRTLDRLAAKGFVRSTLEEPSAARGGNPRKRFSVTPTGIEALQRSRSVVGQLSRGLDDVLGEAR